MVNLKEQVFKALSEIEKVDIFASYPNDFEKLPCISFYESNNSVKSYADDIEFLSEINIAINIWADTNDETSKISFLVNEKMQEIGFLREVSYDIPEQDVKRKFMRFKKLEG